MNYEAYIGRGVHKVTNKDRPVTTLDNISEWVDNIYCIEAGDNVYTADKVLGGRDGVANAQAQALTNRTNFLKDAVMQLVDYVGALRAAIQPHLQNVKAIVVQKSAPADPYNYVWLKTTQNFTDPAVKLTFANGSSVSNPIFRVEFVPRGTVYIRTDGITGELGDISFHSFDD